MDCEGRSHLPGREGGSPATARPAHGVRVDLGDPATWRRERFYVGPPQGWAPSPVAATADPRWVALYSETGELVGAAPRRCPHRGADLLDHAAYDLCPGAMTCRHVGYSWWIGSGGVRTSGQDGAAPPLDVRPIHLRPDGRAYLELRELAA